MTLVTGYFFGAGEPQFALADQEADGNGLKVVVLPEGDDESQNITSGQLSVKHNVQTGKEAGQFNSSK